MLSYSAGGNNGPAIYYPVHPHQMKRHRKILNQLINRRKYKRESNSNAEAEICVICSNEYVDLADIGGIHCGHEFHVPCIAKWLQDNITCPLCRVNVPSIS